MEQTVSIEKDYRQDILGSLRLDDKQLRFLIWMATPPKQRRPGTQEKLAKELGVHYNTLTNWKSMPGFISTANKLSIRFLSEAVPEIIAKLKELAVDGNMNAIDRTLELTEVWNKKQTIEHKFILEDALNELEAAE